MGRAAFSYDKLFLSLNLTKRPHLLNFFIDLGVLDISLWDTIEQRRQYRR